MNKHTRTHRRLAAAALGSSIEFADLLDSIVAASATTVTTVDPFIDSIPVSRFADAGIDDDRLPVHAAKRRHLHR